jgi:AcrR family transcriptional regulator
LRYAADRLLQERVAAAPSLREIASGVGPSTRAVYSLPGSKEGLPGALDTHAMEMLHQWVDAIPVSRDRAGQSSDGLIECRFHGRLGSATTFRYSIT